MIPYMEVSINGGTPIAGWFTMENPNLKLMIEGYPHFRKGSYGLGGDRLDPTLSPIDCLPISHVHSIIYIELVRYIYISISTMKHSRIKHELLGKCIQLAIHSIYSR